MFPEGRQRCASIADSDKTAGVLMSRGANNPHPLLMPRMMHPQHRPVSNHRMGAATGECHLTHHEVSAHISKIFTIRTEIGPCCQLAWWSNAHWRTRSEQTQTLVKVIETITFYRFFIIKICIEANCTHSEQDRLGRGASKRLGDSWEEFTRSAEKPKCKCQLTRC